MQKVIKDFIRSARWYSRHHILGSNCAGKTAAIELSLKPITEHIHPYLWGKICITFCITEVPPKIRLGAFNGGNERQRCRFILKFAQLERIILTMRTNHFMIPYVLFAILLLSACSKPIMVGSKPAVIGLDTDYQVTDSGYHESTSHNEQATDEPAEFQEIRVEDVKVIIEFRAPIPVKVKISGTWPGPCSQLAEIKQTTDGENFAIRLLTTSDEPSCPTSQVMLPFEVDIPLNMTKKHVGSYTVSVNGKETSFDWSGSLLK